MGPKNSLEGKHPDAMINHFMVLLDNMHDATHRVTIYHGPEEIIKGKTCSKTYISYEQLYRMQLAIYHCSKVQVDSVEGERLSQICRCTGSHTWHGREQLNNWVGLTHWARRCYDGVNAHLSSQLQRLSEIKLLNEDGAFVEYWLALALTTMPWNSGNLDPVSKLVQVWQALAWFAMHVLSMGNIVRSTRIFLEIVPSSNTGARWNKY